LANVEAKVKLISHWATLPRFTIWNHPWTIPICFAEIGVSQDQLNSETVLFVLGVWHFIGSSLQ